MLRDDPLFIRFAHFIMICHSYKEEKEKEDEQKKEEEFSILDAVRLNILQK